MPEEKVMKGYKGFEKGLVCRNKQYAENTIFEEDKAEICKNGMHFCENPFDVWRHYPPCNNNGEPNEFAEVEALSEVKTDDKIKFCTSKLKISAKLGFMDFVKAGVEFILTTAKNNIESNTGDYSAATNTGDYSAATNTGNQSAATNTSYRSAATNTGYCSAATNTGDCSAATNTGDYSAATNTGDYSAATNTGNRSAATNTGDYSAAIVEGKNSIAIVTGYQGKAKGDKDCWIVCTEQDKDYNILCVKAVKVDGEKIKENTFYTLKNGEFIESEER